MVLHQQLMLQVPKLSLQHWLWISNPGSLTVPHDLNLIVCCCIGTKCQSRAPQNWAGCRGTVGAFAGKVYYEVGACWLLQQQAATGFENPLIMFYYAFLFSTALIILCEKAGGAWEGVSLRKEVVSGSYSLDHC